MSLLTLALIVAATNTAPNNNGTTTKTNASKTTLKASKNTKGNAANAPQDPNATAPQDGAAATDPKKPKGQKPAAPAADAGEPASLVEQEAHTLFFPHGIGHLVGLGVRDASGRQPGRTRDPRPSLQSLRLDLPLAAGYLVTVEPGIYFIPALLNDAARRSRFAHQVRWELVDQHLALGGVRIEDNVLITPEGPDVLTSAIPKSESCRGL